MFVTDYRLVIVCSNEQRGERSYITERLHLFQRDSQSVTAKDDIIDHYLKTHMMHHINYKDKTIWASEVDPEK